MRTATTSSHGSASIPQRLYLDQLISPSNPPDVPADLLAKLPVPEPVRSNRRRLVTWLERYEKKELEMEQHHRTLDAMQDLHDDWSEDDSPPPSVHAIHRARFLLGSIERFDLLSGLIIEPDAEGGVSFWVETEQPDPMTGLRRSAWMVCDNKGHACAVLSRKIVGEPDRAISFNPLQADEMLAQVSRFLKGATE